MILKGSVFKFGDNINTDEIIPARYLTTSDPDTLAGYCMEDARPGFSRMLQPGDIGNIIVAGKNFGCGSSREHAPLAIKHAGIACVVAVSFARIFFRNAVNIGLPIVECPGSVPEIKEGEKISIDLKEGTIRTDKICGKITPFPEFMQEIIRRGGWIQYLKGTVV